MTTTYLEPAELSAVREAAIASFADPQLRPLLFEGVMPAYIAVLPRLDAPANQLRSDLMRMNALERLVDGSVPLQIWLHNAVGLTLEPAHRAVFERAMDTVTRKATGRPDLGPVAAPAEIKEKIVFSDDTVPFDFLLRGAAAGRSVGRLTVPPYENGVPKSTPLGTPAYPHGGTGWLITPTLLVTNHHVVNARSAVGGPAPHADDADLALQAEATVIEFDYDNEQAESADAHCAGLVAWSPDLDYAVLRLAEPAGRPGLPVRTAPLEATLEDNVAVNVIQHPNGKAKRIGLRNNIVDGTTKREVRYFTDTDSGSSGSPVLTDDWVVCALHRGSQQVDVEFQGKPSAHVNVGTQISAVMDDLAQRFPAAHAEVIAAA
jgi:endonuclease G, mitochondrial